MTLFNAPLFGSALSAALSACLGWFGQTAYKTWNSSVELLQWLCVKIYNVLLEVSEFMFESFVDTFILLLGFFPDVDLSALDESLTTLLEYWRGFDQFLPFSEIFYCVNFLFAYFIVFTVSRLVVKLVPTIG